MVASAVTRSLTGVLLAVAASVGALSGTADGAVQRVAADDGAKITAEHWIDAHTVDLTVRSPALGASVPVRVLVPRTWKRATKASWPVVYAYHGGRDTYVSWTRSTDIAKAAAAYDVMVVMPDTGWAGWFTDWWNGGRRGTPKWETFHTKELLQLMERNYHAGTHRATMGVSSSGYGAVKYAARHPGMFAYAVSLSGILHLTQTGVPALVMFEASEKYDPFRIWGIPGIDDKNWKANDPYELAAKLKGTGLYLASGRTGLPGAHDPAGGEPVELQEVVCGATTVAMVDRLRKLHIPVTAHIYQKGYHDWSTWQPEMHTAWPLMMKAIKAKKLS
ncbi:alpha/beta hydrolase family protein [Actinoallomurus sp. NPDC052308]|uniref:alpha/beta hydrolase n=1 Tax=Actinoallomurus sp. NPDC052308 TaxID=3155530 RepID=UPI003447CAEA